MDGVMNRSTTKYFGRLGAVEPELVKRFNDILEKTGAKFVSSSSWRKWPQCGNILLAAGLNIDYLIGVTPDLNGLVSRGTEIKQFLDTVPDIARYCILDDNGDFLLEQKLFRADPLIGLTQEMADDVIKYLNEN